MRLKILAIAEDVHMNQKLVEIELHTFSVCRLADPKTPEGQKVRVQFEIMPLILDISDGFNPFDGW
jgi:hypothetical protein